MLKAQRVEWQRARGTGKKLLKHPLEHFTFVLAKNLGKTRQEIMAGMDANEIVNWMAYEMTCDSDFREKVKKELALERSAQLSKEQRAKAIKSMFEAMGGK